MFFNSIQFLIFFPIVLLIYFILPQKIRQYWLLLSSYYFYMCWNAKYAILIFISTVITYFSGFALENVKKSKHELAKQLKLKKVIVAISFLSNLGILFYFKYFNFILDSICKLFRVINISIEIPPFDVILPVGISFYTFQALSYTMDVYRGDIYAEKNFFKYALFVSFFPQLVAGPIERSKNLLKQINEPTSFKFDNFREGILLMLWGFFLKIVIADRVSIFVDTVYTDHVNYGGFYLVIATFLFAFQIYCDFYGYSNIAMGTAKILGISLMENFNAPYLSNSVSEFWRNWHISLTSWFKDYLYIPLGGSRKGKVRKYINKLIVFLISGLWHGAQWSFVAWGGINGVYQIIGEILQPVRDRIVVVVGLNRKSLAHKFIHIVGTFVLVDFSWIFFRANRFLDAFNIIKSIITAKNISILFDGISLYNCGLDRQNFLLMMMCIVVLIIADICKTNGVCIRKLVMNQDAWFRYLFISFSICFILLFGKYGPSFDKAAFIYFQF